MKNQERRDMSHETDAVAADIPAGNVGALDRVISALAGVGVVAYSLLNAVKRPWRAAFALAGAPLLARALRGRSRLYDLLGVSTVHDRPPQRGTQPELSRYVEASETIQVEPQDLYDFWKQLDNLPRFMEHLQRVTPLPGGGWHWVAAAPAGGDVEWDADVTQDIPGRLIAWRSRPGSQIANEGFVEFAQAPEGRGTELRVRLMYEPPAGQLGVLVAKLFGEEPKQQIEGDLMRLKKLIESGDIPNLCTSAKRRIPDAEADLFNDSPVGA
jgi:uncharacterized membrane protein